MLVNPKFRYDRQLMSVLSLIGQGGEPEEIEPGIFMSNSFSIGESIANNKNEWPDFEDLSPYGVCDTIDQVKGKYEKFLKDPELKYCISFTKVVKSEQPNRYGWRWHKWGEYIGTKNTQHEYLYDEDDDIQEVYCYHIYQIL